MLRFDLDLGAQLRFRTRKVFGKTFDLRSAAYFGRITRHSGMPLGVYLNKIGLYGNQEAVDHAFGKRFSH